MKAQEACQVFWAHQNCGSPFQCMRLSQLSVAPETVLIELIHLDHDGIKCMQAEPELLGESTNPGQGSHTTNSKTNVPGLPGMWSQPMESNAQCSACKFVIQWNRFGIVFVTPGVVPIQVVIAKFVLQQTTDVTLWLF